MKPTFFVAAATVAAMALGGAPAFAATDTSTQSPGTGALSCPSGGNGDNLRAEKDQLFQQLRLETKQAVTIDSWNGCLKVSYVNNSGHSVTALYDPDTFDLVNKIS